MTTDYTSAIITGSQPVFAAPIHAETVPDSADPVEWAQRCVAHGYHQPVPRYLEYHHVIPRAWQAAWVPPAFTVPNTAGYVWHPETVPVCRTGHGNVHYWIERAMRAYEGDVQAAFAAAEHDQESKGRREVSVARRAFDEWIAAGGDIGFLVQHHLWGGLYGGNAGE